MESSKQELLRIINNAYCINKDDVVYITLSDNITRKYTCKYKSGYNMFIVNSNKTLYDNSYNTLDNLRNKLVKDFMLGMITNIRVK